MYPSKAIALHLSITCPSLPALSCDRLGVNSNPIESSSPIFTAYSFDNGKYLYSFLGLSYKFLTKQFSHLSTIYNYLIVAYIPY